MYKKLTLAGLMIFSSITLFAQSEIKGKLITSDGSPAPEVNVSIRELSITVVSNQEGIFKIGNLKPGNYNLKLTSAGLKSQDKDVSLADNDIKYLEFRLVENLTELQEVIVNAKRTLNSQIVNLGKAPINPMDLPQSIAVINQSVMRDQQSQKLSDVIRNVNGVYLAGTRASTQESFYARGYNFSSNNLFKNGSRVNSGAMPEISSLEKVEVLKGSAAILYGNVAPGGIVNMVTKQPKFKSGGEISLRAGSYGLIKPSVDVYGPITSKIAFRVNGTYENSDSYRESVSSEKFYVNPSLLFKLGSRTQLVLQGDYMDHRFTPDFGIGSYNDTIVPDLPRGRFLGTKWQYNETRQATATANLKHSFNQNWTLNSNVSYQLFDRDYYAVERIQGKANADWYRPLGRIDTRENYYIANIDLVGKLKTGKIEHTLLAGIDADRYFTTAYNFDVTGKTYDTINILDPLKYTPRTDIPVATRITQVQTPVNRYGVYVQDLVNLSNKFKLLAGIRWSKQNSEAVSTTYLLKDSTAKGKAVNVDAFSPRAGLVYQPTKHISIFGSYANSFSPNTGTDVFGNAMEPSIIDQFELGIKNEILDGKLSANLTVYKIVNNNLAQMARYRADGVTINNNSAIKEMAGQTTSIGIEIDMSGEPMKGLALMGGYSFNDMRYTKTKKDKGYFVEGERLVNTPQHTANLSGFYTFQKGTFRGLKLGAAGFYTGKRFGGWNNTYPAPGQPALKTRLIPVEAFTTVDLSAGYCFKKISVMAKLSNLFNTYNYNVHENYSINPIAPRQFIATISWKF